MARFCAVGRFGGALRDERSTEVARSVAISFAVVLESIPQQYANGGQWSPAVAE